MRLKETAIQERDSPKGSSSASRFGPTIECAEEQWLKQVAVQPAATGETIIDRLPEEVWSPVQPSFALHEVEE